MGSRSLSFTPSLSLFLFVCVCVFCSSSRYFVRCTNGQRLDFVVFVYGLLNQKGYFAYYFRLGRPGSYKRAQFSISIPTCISSILYTTYNKVHRERQEHAYRTDPEMGCIMLLWENFYLACEINLRFR